MDYKDVILLLIAIPVLISFILVVWMIMFSLIGMIIEVIKESLEK